MSVNRSFRRFGDLRRLLIHCINTSLDIRFWSDGKF